MGIDSVFSGVVSAGNPTAEAVLGITTNIAKRLTPREIPPFNPMEDFVDLGLQASLREVLERHFVDEGLEVASATKKTYDRSREHKYTALKTPDHEIALLQLPNIIFKFPDIYIGPFLTLLKAFRGTSTRFFSQNEPALKKGFKLAFEDEKQMRGDDWIYLNWDDIEDFLKGMAGFSVLEIFEVEVVRVSETVPSRRLRGTEVQKIVKILEKTATTADPGLGVRGYFRKLVERSGWPEGWKNATIDTWSGDAEANANRLVSFTMGKGLFPRGHEKQGDVLGWLLWDLLQFTDVGGPEDTELANLILEFQLIQDPNVINEIRRRYRQG
jgi:hypothetical protein